MKNFLKIATFLILLITWISSPKSYAQVSIDKKIDMTGATNDDRRIINVGDVVAGADAVNAQTLQKGSLIYIATVGGNGDAITASTTPSFIPQAGTTVYFKAASSNTGSATLNVNGAGPFTLYKNGNNSLIANEIKVGQIIIATFDGNNWQIGGSDNLGNHQATQTITTNVNDMYDIGNGASSFKDAYFTGSVKLDNATFISNGGNTNTFIGETQNTTNSATDNTFIGYQTGKTNSSGYGNVFAGYQTGMNNTGAGYSIFIGYQSGYNNTSGYANIFQGYQSGYNNTSGSYNSFLGMYSGNNNTTGNDNIAVGYLSGYLNSTGNGNISLGNSAGVYNTASQNIFIGNSSGYYNSSGNANVSIGYQAGYTSTTGSNNTYLGYRAAPSLSSGSGNVFIGSQVAPSLTTGNDNVIIGNDAGLSFGPTNYSYATAVGKGANIGFNTTSATTIGNSSAAFGNNSTAIGASSLVNTGTSNSTAIGYFSQVNTNNTVAIGNSNVTCWILGRTNSVAGVALIVGTNNTNGNGAYLTQGGVWTNTSDKNKKENFKELNGKDILAKINELKITQWNYIGENASIKHIGPMAQDFYKLFQLGNDNKSISTIDPAGIALIAIQELDKKDKELEAKIKEIEILKSRLETSEIKIDILSEQLNEIKLLIDKEEKKEAMK